MGYIYIYIYVHININMYIILRILKNIMKKNKKFSTPVTFITRVKSLTKHES